MTPINYLLSEETKNIELNTTNKYFSQSSTSITTTTKSDEICQVPNIIFYLRLATVAFIIITLTIMGVIFITYFVVKMRINSILY